MGTLENTFSWSNSRAATFRRCLRAYWWQYYGTWEGWERHAPPRTREAYMLKNLSNRWMWVGNAVHARIERILRRIQDQAAQDRLQFEGAGVDVEREVESLTKTMRREYRESRSQRYRDSPKRHFGLMEHEYEDPVPREEWQATSDRAREALRGFLTSEVFARILRSDPAAWFPIEHLDQFHLDDVGVWASPDFARRLDDDHAELYDWKTGAVRPEKSRLQMACYTLYMEEKHGIEPSRLRNHLVYLGREVTVHDFVFSAEDLEEARGQIRESMAQMRSRLADVAANRAEMDAFEMTDDRTRCAVCVYRRLCGR